LTGAAADAAQWVPPGWNSDAANDAGNANQPDWGDKRVQPVGRSRVIHMLWNGFLFVGVEPGEKPWSRWLMGWAAAWGCTRVACAWTPWDPWVHAAGSGNAPAASWGRNEDPAIRATNRLTAATSAMVNCHRRVVAALRRSTVPQLYKTWLGQQPQRAVKTIKVRCVLPYGVLAGPGRTAPYLVAWPPANRHGSAAATRNRQVLANIGAGAAEAYHAALGAAAIMGMNNVFYRGRGITQHPLLEGSGGNGTTWPQVPACVGGVGSGRTERCFARS